MVWRGTGLALRRERGTLRRRQLLAAGVGEEAIEAAGRVPDMKADRRGARRGRPYLIHAQSPEVNLNFVAALKQPVGNRLKQRGCIRNGPAKPPFRRRLVGSHCFVTVHVPVRAGLSVPFAWTAHVPFALLPSNVAPSATSADSSGGKSYLAVILFPSNESALKRAL